jgi:hypothetical protein
MSSISAFLAAVMFWAARGQGLPHDPRQCPRRGAPAVHQRKRNPERDRAGRRPHVSAPLCRDLRKRFIRAHAQRQHRVGGMAARSPGWRGPSAGVTATSHISETVGSRGDVRLRVSSNDRGSVDARGGSTCAQWAPASDADDAHHQRTPAVSVSRKEWKAQRSRQESRPLAFRIPPLRLRHLRSLDAEPQHRIRAGLRIVRDRRPNKLAILQLQ